DVRHRPDHALDRIPYPEVVLFEVHHGLRALVRHGSACSDHEPDALAQQPLNLAVDPGFRHRLANLPRLRARPEPWALAIVLDEVAEGLAIARAAMPGQPDRTEPARRPLLGEHEPALTLFADPVGGGDAHAVEGDGVLPC